MINAQIKKGWEKVKLFEIADIIMGQSPKSEFYTNNTDDLPFYQGCTEFQDLHPVEKQYCSSPTKISEKNDVLMSVRAPVGLLNITTKKCCIGRGLCAIRPRDNRYWFLYYLLKANVEYIQSFQKGSVYGAVNKNDVINLEFLIPDNDQEKDKIASILSAFDDLIENNTKRIKILEKTAQLIYKEWFVDFKFPGHENVKMVESGTEFGEIPNGWEVKFFSDLVEINPRITFPKNKLHRFVPMSHISTNAFISIEKRQSTKSGKKFGHRDVLLARITPCLENNKGGFALLDDKNEIIFGSTEFIVFREDVLPAEYIYALSRGEKFRKHAQKSMVGASGRQRVQEACFSSYEVPCPTGDILSKFSSTTKSFFEGIYKYEYQNSKLRKTRDLLLPKLISGEVEVSDLQILDTLNPYG